MLEKTKGQGGITLVALVVTIVVLLILAGITIALVFAQDGVIGKAQEAAQGSNEGMVAENIHDAIVAAQIDALAYGTAGSVTGAIGTTGIEITGGTITINADGTVEASDVTATFDGDTYDISYADGVVTATVQPGA